MGLEGIILSEVSQTEKEKYCMIELMWNLKKKKKKKIRTESSLPCSSGAEE